jgi:hypothetical protein
MTSPDWSNFIAYVAQLRAAIFKKRVVIGGRRGDRAYNTTIAPSRSTTRHIASDTMGPSPSKITGEVTACSHQIKETRWNWPRNICDE